MKIIAIVGAGLLGALGWVALAGSRGETVLGEYRTTLLGRSANQRHNALMAISKLNGAEIPPHGDFSFNGRIGSFSRDAGYRRAPVSYNGQLIDAWGGGVCQASTTTYNAALISGLGILERTQHHFAPSYVPVGRDAAVAFGNIDLKLKNPYGFPVRIRAQVDGETIRVAFIADQAAPERPVIERELARRDPAGLVRVGQGGRFGRLRNSGKDGYSVTVYRRWSGRRERISTDVYPAMSRVIEIR